MQELLKMICCPETHQPFQMAEARFVSELNEKIKAGQVKTRGGKIVSEAVDAGFVREDRKYLYPVRNNIPVLLINESIPL